MKIYNAILQLNIIILLNAIRSQFATFNFSTDRSKAVPLLQVFFVPASVVSYVKFVL